jgi:hypothetical protein
MYERLDSPNERSWGVYRRNELKPAWQDFSALDFDICGFTGVITFVLNT